MLGAPGSGKGTQAKSLQTSYGFPQISTGDLLRKAVADRTPLGMEAKAVMDAGDLVSDAIVLGMIQERIARTDAAAGFVLDGYPRNRAQAEDLDGVFRGQKLMLDASLLMDVSTEVLMKRLTGRRTCSKTGKLLNVYFSPQDELDACVREGGELLQRADDTEEIIANRLQVYQQQTAPLIEYYAGRELLRVVAAEGAIDDVYRRLQTALGLSPT
jgi:adenylate kinase